MAVLSAQEKQQLLASVAEHFKGYEFVGEIVVVPDAYLRPKGGFANLDQLKRMFGCDIIALVSYDQTSFTSEGLASVAYWTIIGAYIVQGEKNSTHTLLDTVVYDIESRELLFRAPGTSSNKSSATLANLSQRLREDARKGFTDASEEMIANLDAELLRFRERVKQQPSSYRLVDRSSGGAAGADWPLLAAGLVLALWLRCRRGC